MRVGKVLKNWRILSQMDTKEAAEMIGIGATTYRRLEEGSTPPHGETVVKIIRWLLEDDRVTDGIAIQSAGEQAAENRVVLPVESGEEVQQPVVAQSVRVESADTD